MRYRVLAVLPVSAVVLFVLALVVVGEGARPLVVRGANESGKALALLGCVAAALAFERGEYLRRAWILSATCLGLLLARDALLLVEGDAARLDSLRVGLSFVANLLAVIGTLMIARAWKVAGMSLPGSWSARGAAVGIALGIALALAGPSAYVNLGLSLHGDPRGLIGLASDLGDILSTTLLAPVLLTAIAVRGGLLRWPWGLLTASLFAWLLYDTFVTALGEVPGYGQGFKLVGEGFRVLACTLQCAAGLAQRFVVRGPAPPG